MPLLCSGSCYVVFKLSSCICFMYLSSSCSLVCPIVVPLAFLCYPVICLLCVCFVIVMSLVFLMLSYVLECFSLAVFYGSVVLPSVFGKLSVVVL